MAAQTHKDGAAKVLPISARDLVRFTPPSFKDGDPAAPVYLLAVPDLRTRNRIDRDIDFEGAHQVSLSEIYEALRDACNALLTGESLEQALADVGVIEATVAQLVAGRASEIDREAYAAAQIRVSEVEKISLEWPPFARVEGQRKYYVKTRQLVAVQHCLRGWENVDATFRLERGLASDESIEAIARDVTAIGAEIVNLMVVSEKRRKN